MRAVVLLLMPAVFGLHTGLDAAQSSSRWSEEKANAWTSNRPWLVGCNFIPSSAINQLEMWQAETFDLVTIDRELGWAAGLGFNSIRVFLHDLLWQQDRRGLTERMEQFLNTADRHGIGVMFVLLDGVWDPSPRAGTQPEPRPYVHNSGWVQSPGAAILGDPVRHDELMSYIRGVIEHFRADPRVDAWDLFNEPDNENRESYGESELAEKARLALVLLERVFTWARDVSPTQPITAAVWRGEWASDDSLSPIDRLLLDRSDVISFHSYSELGDVQRRVEALRRYRRPILCTEYMARPVGSTFQSVMPYLKKERVAAYNWGLVSGKTQTIYPWDSWTKAYTAEPPLWFHDIFRKDGTPFDQGEVDRIREITGKR